MANNQNIKLPPILQSILACNQKLFNGALNDQYAKLKHHRVANFQPQQAPQSSQSSQNQQQQQYQQATLSQQQPSSSALAAETTSLAASSHNLTLNPVKSTQSFYSSKQEQKLETDLIEKTKVVEQTIIKPEIKTETLVPSKFYSKKPEPPPPPSPQQKQQLQQQQSVVIQRLSKVI